MSPSPKAGYTSRPPEPPRETLELPKADPETSGVESTCCLGQACLPRLAQVSGREPGAGCPKRRMCPPDRSFAELPEAARRYDAEPGVSGGPSPSQGLERTETGSDSDIQYSPLSGNVRRRMLKQTSGLLPRYAVVSGPCSSATAAPGSTNGYGWALAPKSSSTSKSASGCTLTGPANGWLMAMITSSPEKIRKDRMPVIMA